MVGEGPFLWLSKDAPPAGFRDVPPGGMCLSAFLFVRQGHTILLGKYRDDPRWETLAGLDEWRRRIHRRGGAIPARQLRCGEGPRGGAGGGARGIIEVIGV